MGSHDFEIIEFGAPAVPAINGVAVLFDSTVFFNKMGLSMMRVGRVQLAFPGLDQAGTLTGYTSKDKGATWNQFAFGGGTTLPATVAADTTTDHSSYDIFVATEKDVKFTFTAGGTAPTVWNPTIKCQTGNTHSGT
jgi:hypothetical protein